MSAEAAALGAGKSIAKLIANRWIAGRAARVEATADLINLVKTGFPDDVMQRKAVRKFEDMADSVFDRLRPLIQQEYRELDDGTRAAVLNQVVEVLDRADLSDRALLGDDMDPRKVAQRLRPLFPARKAKFEFGEDGARLYDVVLDECCVCLAHLLIGLPQFVPRAEADMLGRLSKITENFELALSRLPVQSLTAPEGDEFGFHHLAPSNGSH